MSYGEIHRFIVGVLYPLVHNLKTKISIFSYLHMLPQHSGAITLGWQRRKNTYFSF